MSRLDADGLPWAELRELRTRFLGGSAGEAPYWRTTDLLDAYDRTFGERIGWKWDFVLDELELRGWTPPSGTVLDWGCGSGVAGRRFLERFPTAGALRCHDRSSRAEAYAVDRANSAGIAVSDQADPATLVVSHVIGELDDASLQHLIGVASTATAVVWVEPGDHRSSRLLIDVRERLRPDAAVVAPCTHQEACGLLAGGNDRHWCHHFAAPPPEAFTDPGWGRFASETGIDLRSLPVSFLVTDTRSAIDRTDLVHTIGRPRISKSEARVFCCDSTGVFDCRITKRRLPDSYRLAKKGRLATLARWRCDGDEIVDWVPLPGV